MGCRCIASSGILSSDKLSVTCMHNFFNSYNSLQNLEFNYPFKYPVVSMLADSSTVVTHRHLKPDYLFMSNPLAVFSEVVFENTFLTHLLDQFQNPEGSELGGI